MCKILFNIFYFDILHTFVKFRYLQVLAFLPAHMYTHTHIYKDIIHTLSYKIANRF